ncbi:MAG TPA: ATP-binding cassette domain-containing protein [Solirubrobacterales bacterium]|nr:ATP-binding cassette domain-containing protein [Solirubrobacterales bacterium]
MTALRLQGLRKEFGGIVALEGIDLEVERGEIVAVVGDNGAGKSTLIKLISGVHRPTSGMLYVDGKPQRFHDPIAARAAGIEVVYQDLALVDHQPVYMNLFLGRELITRFRRLDRKRMSRETQQLVDELDIRIPSAQVRISTLSGGQRQGIAISRATHWARSLVLLDEPTAALGVAETAKVEETIAQLRGRGLAMVVVSHNLDQVFRLADRVVVLRRGVHVATRRIAEIDRNEIVAMITGLSTGGAFA